MEQNQGGFMEEYQNRRGDHEGTYLKVASSSLSRLVAHFWIFRLFMKVKFDAYVL